MEFDFISVIFDSPIIFFLCFNHLAQMDNFLRLNFHFDFDVVQILCALLDLITHQLMVFNSLASLEFSCAHSCIVLPYSFLSDLFVFGEVLDLLILLYSEFLKDS